MNVFIYICVGVCRYTGYIKVDKVKLVNIVGTSWEHSGEDYDRMIAGKKMLIVGQIGNARVKWKYD